MRYPFPSVLDASIITTWKACPKQAWFAYIRRMVPAGRSIHLVAGGAFASAMERARTLWFREGVRDQDLIYREALKTLWRNYPTDFDIPDRHRAKGPDVLAEGLVKFLDSFNFAYDNLKPVRMTHKDGIEFNFSVPLPINHPETGDPILYCGRWDTIVETPEGLLLVEDDKTTSSYGPDWSTNFSMRYQFLGYVWAGRQSGFDVAGVVVRGLVLSISQTTGIKTIQDIKLFPDWKVERWYEQMLKDVAGMVTDWQTDNWEYDFSQSCTSYGGCDYADTKERTGPCNQLDHEAALLDGTFVPNEWSPLVQIKEAA